MSENVNSVRLPRVVVNAGAAEELFRSVVVNDSGDEFIVYARAVAVSSSSFADRLVELISSQGKRNIRLLGSTRQLEVDMTESAGRFGVVVR